MREKKYIVGNWKMNQNLPTIMAFLKTLSESKTNNCHQWIAPQFIHIPALLNSKSNIPNLVVGAQNCSSHSSGAFTGEVSPDSLKDLGADFVILGHSERRQIFQESNELINQKVKLALKSGLKVIYCLGETLSERENNKTFDVLNEQVLKGLSGLTVTKNKLLLAYEPVWAIGTGKTATPQMAEEAHAYIRKVLEKTIEGASDVPILYGGSVKPDNAKELMQCPNIDGGLVGGASLKIQDYLALCGAV